MSKFTPGRRTLIAAAFAATFAVGGIAASVLPAAADGFAEMHGGHGHGGHGGHGGGPGGPGGPGMMLSPGHLQRLFEAVDATPEQRTKIEAIAAGARKELEGVHGGLRDTHGKLHALLLAPTIDRGAIEQLRAGQMARFDAASRVMTKALADAADVLRPDQRAKLGKMMEERHKGGGFMCPAAPPSRSRF